MKIFLFAVGAISLLFALPPALAAGKDSAPEGDELALFRLEEEIVVVSHRPSKKTAVPPAPVPASAPKAPAGPAAAPVELTPDMTAPRKLSGPDPEYTQDAFEHGIEGVMVVRCVVGVDGRVNGCAVQKGLPFMDDAVVSALEQRTYSPAERQGKAVAVYHTFKIRLQLPSD